MQYDAPLTVDDMVGGAFSAMSADRLPSMQARATFTAEVRDALGGRDKVTERIRVWLQCIKDMMPLCCCDRPFC